jgi:hypothetical protein
MNKPTCKQCDKKGKKYSVYQGMSTTTLMAWGNPYWNEDGDYIIPPNPNTTTTQYRCSNGHNWSETN